MRLQQEPKKAANLIVAPRRLRVWSPLSLSGASGVEYLCEHRRKGALRLRDQLHIAFVPAAAWTYSGDGYRVALGLFSITAIT